MVRWRTSSSAISSKTSAEAGYFLRSPWAITLQKFMEVLGTQPPREQNTAAAMYRDPASQAGRPNYVAQHLHEVAIDHANGVFAGTNNHVLEIGGRAPLTVEAFVDKHRAAFL
jgi:hypothetical protein